MLTFAPVRLIDCCIFSSAEKHPKVTFECAELKDELKKMSKMKYELDDEVRTLRNEGETTKRKFESEFASEAKRASKLQRKLKKSVDKVENLEEAARKKDEQLAEKDLQLTVFQEAAAKEEQLKQQREMMEQMLRVHAVNTKNHLSSCNIL